ncbi:MAG: hypothetical protein WD396_00585 [Pseudohongiellaceae bacterium]
MIKRQTQQFNAALYQWLVTLTLALPGLIMADTPPGWINANNDSAYTTTRGELALSIAGLKVNDTIDFLDIREDLLAGDRRLEGDSGDLSGLRIALDFGVTEWLSLFYREQRHALRVELGEISSVNVIDIDRDLETTAREAGLKWTFYAADLFNPGGRHTAASLEVSAFRNSSESFDVIADQLRFRNVELFFSEPRTFSVNQLEDDGWQARLLFSRALSGSAVGSAWLGYKDSEARAATDTNIDSVTVNRLFKQAFRLKEDFLKAGLSLNFNLAPRLPLLLSYEFIRSNSASFTRDPAEPVESLPGFLRGRAPAADSNHTLYVRASYWLTPTLSVALSGNLYSNQFLGLLPHYNNPLSGSFADKPYGYAGIELSYLLRDLFGNR